MIRPFLVDAPRPGIDDVTGFMLLDVDGVLNILNDTVDRESLPTVPGSSGRPLPINLVGEEIIAVLDDALREGVWLGWLTTWGFRVDRLEGLLGGRLRGGFVVTERPAVFFSPADWKMNAVTRLKDAHPSAALCWCDDDAIPLGLQFGSVSQRYADAVLIAPTPEVGLTLDQARRMAAHLSA